jgi:hypothetical protein
MYAWDEETSLLVDWFLAADPPAKRFRLKPGVEVTEPDKFCEGLKNDIAQGVEGARARTGALQDDLRALFDLFANEEGPNTSR